MGNERQEGDILSHYPEFSTDSAPNHGAITGALASTSRPQADERASRELYDQWDGLATRRSPVIIEG